MAATITSSMAFLSPMKLYEREKPYFSNIPFFEIEGARQSNLRTLPEDVTFVDLRPNVTLFSLDQHGFQILKVPALGKAEDFEDEDWIRHVYEPEVKEIIMRATGANRVEVFDHTVIIIYPQSWLGASESDSD